MQLLRAIKGDLSKMTPSIKKEGRLADTARVPQNLRGKQWVIRTSYSTEARYIWQYPFFKWGKGGKFMECLQNRPNDQLNVWNKIVEIKYSPKQHRTWTLNLFCTTSVTKPCYPCNLKIFLSPKGLVRIFLLQTKSKDWKFLGYM